MLEIKTVLAMNITACFLLAVSLRAAIRTSLRESRDGLWLWLASLVVQATAYSLLAASDAGNLALYQVAAHAVLATFLTLQAAAVFQFFGRQLGSWWHLFPGLLVATLFGLAAGSAATLTIFAGVFFGTAYVVLAGVTSHLGAGMKSAGLRLLVIGYAVGAVAFFVRGLPAIVMPDALGGFYSPDKLLVIGLYLSFAVLLLTSMGFLVLQKDRAEEAATQLAITDPLTGTFNRRTFLDLAEKEIARARRSSTRLCLVMLDLDHFKSINDRFGHLAGDYVLKRFVEVTKLCLRQEDLLVRYGGEEFCVLLPDTDVESAAALAERIRIAIENSSFVYREGKTDKAIQVTVSAGIAQLDDDLSEEIGSLVSRTDEALYAAKEAGRNQVAIFPVDGADIATLTRSQRIRAFVPAARKQAEVVSPTG
jgi:diguanylate cyclase (GGDEF)-like protein